MVLVEGDGVLMPRFQSAAAGLLVRTAGVTFDTAFAALRQAGVTTALARGGPVAPRLRQAFTDAGGWWSDDVRRRLEAQLVPCLPYGKVEAWASRADVVVAGWHDRDVVSAVLDAAGLSALVRVDGVTAQGESDVAAGLRRAADGRRGLIVAGDDVAEAARQCGLEVVPSDGWRVWVAEVDRRLGTTPEPEDD